MTYNKVKSLMEENPKITREEVMKKCKCGDLQAAAWMQRFVAETAARKRTLFDGRYKGPKPIPHRRSTNKKPVKRTVERSPNKLP